ncbi:hypothetical protein LSH36_491g05046 [Paralvinella palmiformis]|uniref:Uncharacterized protein n=1 Tax=Paralvinella palmiformis TaxID=53620 RepID=A0AAD9J960_9ANNE|nr:hypothetical protein LSH36_491g05046 [Paralvinella palmiformis]
MSDDDSDMSELMNKAFPIEINDTEFDLDVPPTSGMEYLRRVQLEAKKCPAIVVADIDASLYREQQTFKISWSSGLHPAPSGYAPRIKCQRQTVAVFSSARQPDKKDVDGWCHLCFGNLHPLPRKPTSESETVNEDNGTSVNSDGTPPLLSILTSMDQGQWFYALLMCLEKPLDPEVCALLRNLARNCASLRATLVSIILCLFVIIQCWVLFFVMDCDMDHNHLVLSLSYKTLYH